MSNSSGRRRIRAFTLTALTLAVTLAGAACGKDGGGLTDPGPGPDPVDPGPTDPGPEPAPVPVGQVVYAVDLENNFLVFGTESFDVLSGQARIQGLPILKRIIGIVHRPSDGTLYGVGNDSRVYTIDPSTAVATPVTDQQFEPNIASFFDIHFAMALEPNGNRVRLIATEGGGNWSISLDDGTAIMGERVHFVAGDPNEGETPHIAALIFAPASPTAALKAAGAPASSSGTCTEVMYLIDPDLAQYIGSCDPGSGDLGTLGPIEDVAWARCMEVMTDPNGDVIPSEGNPYGMGNTFVAAMRALQPSGVRSGSAALVTEDLNSWGRINPDGTITWLGHTRGKAIQTATIAPAGTADFSQLAPLARVEPEMQALVASADDPRVHCGS
jgi:hypothetical protein